MSFKQIADEQSSIGQESPGTSLALLGRPMLPPPDEPATIDAEFISGTENRPATPPRIEPPPASQAAPAAQSSFEFGPDNAKHPEAFPWQAPAEETGGAAAAAVGTGVGIVGAQAAIEGVKMLGEAAKSPAGSIGAFLPGSGGGGGSDYAGAAYSRAILAALNSAGNIPTRF